MLWRISASCLERFISLYDSPYNGLTMCAGSLGCVRSNDFVKMLDYFCGKKRVNFVHARNVLLILNIITDNKRNNKPNKKPNTS